MQLILIKINNACIAAGKPLPVFNIDFTGLMVTFYARQETVEKTVEKTVKKTVEKTVEKDSPSLILQLIEQNPKISSIALQKATGLSRRGIEWNIEKLKKEGKLKRIGPDKGGHWKIFH